MQDIPQPMLLDPDRLLLDDRNDLSAEEHASRAALLDKALHETCAYARQLWQDVDAMRGYLLESLPSQAGADGGVERRLTAPTGPDDEEGWERWTAAYAAITSVLAGPHGDSGFGMTEARREARDRRAMLERLATAEDDAAQTAAEAAARTASDQAESDQAEADRSPSRRPAAHGAGKRRPIRLAARALVLLLAVRGLRRSPG
jgi:hypothetical protein